MARWEYRVIELGDVVEDDEDRVTEYEVLLNELGEDGWELVTVTETEYIDETDPDEAGVASGTTIAYLKREKP